MILCSSSIRPCFERQTGSVGAGGASDEVGAGAIGPHLQLLHGGGAEGVAGDNQHPGALAFQVGGDLAQRRGLAGPVHADEQHHIGFGTRERGKDPLTRAQLLTDGVGQRLADVIVVDVLPERLCGEPRRDPGGRVRTEVGLDQHLFQFVELGLIQRRLGDEHLGDLLAHLFRRPGEAFGEPREPAAFWV
jgi:hypothetical protein